MFLACAPLRSVTARQVERVAALTEEAGRPGRRRSSPNSSWETASSKPRLGVITEIRIERVHGMASTDWTPW
jgi:hypothetical protein